MSRKGRPMIEDVIRYASGRINQSATRKLAEATRKVAGNQDAGSPSPKLKRERDLFNAICFKGGGLGNHCGDGIGQLWLVGKLDIQGYDDVKLLEAARTWYRGKEEVHKATAARTARYERQDRGEPSTKTNKLEREYYRYENEMRGVDPYDRECLSDLMEPLADGSPQWWVARIIQTEILKFVKLPLVELACDDDLAKFDAAMRALLTMAEYEARFRDAAA